MDVLAHSTGGRATRQHQKLQAKAYSREKGAAQARGAEMTEAGLKEVKAVRENSLTIHLKLTPERKYQALKHEHGAGGKTLAAPTLH